MALGDCWKQLSWFYYQYLLVTALYMLEPWERTVFNSLLISVAGMAIYTGYVFMPQHIMAILHYFEVVQWHDDSTHRLPVPGFLSVSLPARPVCLRSPGFEVGDCFRTCRGRTSPPPFQSYFKGQSSERHVGRWHHDGFPSTRLNDLGLWAASSCETGTLEGGALGFVSHVFIFWNQAHLTGFEDDVVVWSDGTAFFFLLYFIQTSKRCRLLFRGGKQQLCMSQIWILEQNRTSEWLFCWSCFFKERTSVIFNRFHHFEDTLTLLCSNDTHHNANVNACCYR